MQSPLDAREVTWEDLKKYIYDVDGSWRDIYVLDTTREDWKKWVDFVNANYRVVFNDQIDEHRTQIDFDAVLHLWDSKGNALMLTASVYVGEIDINCHFFGDDEIDNDIDPRKIDSPVAHQQLMRYMTQLSHLLGKEVVLTGENDSPKRLAYPWEWAPLVAVSGDHIQVYPYWRNSRG